MWINDETSFRVNFKETKNENDNKNDDENEINKIKINLLNFLNFSTLYRLIKNFDSKSKLKFTL